MHLLRFSLFLFVIFSLCFPVVEGAFFPGHASLFWDFVWSSILGVFDAEHRNLVSSGADLVLQVAGARFVAGMVVTMLLAMAAAWGLEAVTRQRFTATGSNKRGANV